MIVESTIVPFFRINPRSVSMATTCLNSSPCIPFRISRFRKRLGGIASGVKALSINEDESYIITPKPDKVVTGELDITSLQLYPCNNVRMRPIGTVTLRGGVYKNNIYCPDVGLNASNTDLQTHNGREDYSVTATNGRVKLYGSW